MHRRVIDAGVKHSVVFGNEVDVVENDAVYIRTHLPDHREPDVVQLSWRTQNTIEDLSGVELKMIAQPRRRAFIGEVENECVNVD